MRITLIIAILLVPFFAGCGGQDNPFGTVYVEGTVTFDGQPIDGVSITLIPRDEGEQLSAGGVTDANGKFTVTAGGSPAGSGARPGMYDVTFSKISIPRGASPEEDMMMYGGRRPPTTFHIPERYGNVRTSGLEPIVVDTNRRNNVFNFALTSE
ncbi:MAG: carboxypeptidase-like regulatory domain-containing protein [Planctomycetaceae bacterium]|nr:carboxypeptidase-like regulatory domain-containing protein [Planctomycetaceae bacterium]